MPLRLPSRRRLVQTLSLIHISKLKEIRQYAVVPEQSSDKLVVQAKFGVAVEKWMEANEIDAVAIQCWDSLEQNYGTICFVLNAHQSSLQSLDELQLALGQTCGFFLG